MTVPDVSPQLVVQDGPLPIPPGCLGGIGSSPQPRGTFSEINTSYEESYFVNSDLTEGKCLYTLFHENLIYILETIGIAVVIFMVLHVFYKCNNNCVA